MRISSQSPNVRNRNLNDFEMLKWGAVEGVSVAQDLLLLWLLQKASSGVHQAPTIFLNT